MTNPFEVHELLARAGAILCCSHGLLARGDTAHLVAGVLTLDLAKQRLFCQAE